MSFHGINKPHINLVMVAVGKHKNSGHAFRWTTNNIDNPIIIAVHVKHKGIPHQGTNVFPPDEKDVANVFNPLREMCNEKVVKLKEAIVDDSDIARGILDYAKRNHIQTIIIGAPSCYKKNVLSRKFRGQDDVPTAIMKSAPDYSSVYVISKGKVVESRPAIVPLGTVVSQSHAITPCKSENDIRHTFRRGGSTNSRSGRSIYEMLKSFSSNKQSLESIDLSSRSQRSPPFSHNSSLNGSSGSHKFGSLNVAKLERDLSSLASDSQSVGEMEAEMKELRLKLRQTMNMYKTACKEAISAQNKANEINQWKMEEARMVEEVMIQYTLEEIETATQNFSLSMKIGEGGYGPVFKGQLDHTHVAIKILRPDANQGRKQFLQEVEILCNIRHPNMVLLLGACQEYGCLVYEYMDNGSLEDRLLRKQNSPPIPWQKRFEIAYEIATALLFLHQSKPEAIVHRDLKPANILLDKNFVSKISDVGLSRLVPPSVADTVTQYHMTAAAGTLCYIDPEYQNTGKLTTKSDIYSLGIMFLQIVTVKPAMGLSHHVKRAIENGNFIDMLDPVITDWPVDEALVFAKLALRCAELSKKDRPDLALEVIPELTRLRDFGCKYQNYQQNHNHALRPPQNPL
nr:nodulation protein [Melilotus officinalis]